MKPFALVYKYSDGSGCEIIYVGSDRGDALDALLAYGEKGYFDAHGLKLDYGFNHHASAE